MPQLTQQFRINSTNLALRKQFVRITDSDVQVLRGLKKWAYSIADDLAHQFYSHQFGFSETRQFFETYAAEKGVPMKKFRKRLESTQAEYFRQIFDAAADGDNLDETYYERRLHVGKLHNIIDLPLKWYIGSYSTYEYLVRRALYRRYWYNPYKIYRAEKAIFSVFNFDMQAVTDAFFYDYLQAIGLDLATIKVDNVNHDLSEHYREMKSAVRTTLQETMRTANRLNEASIRLTEVSAQADVATNQIATTVQEVARGAFQQAEAATNTVTLVSHISQVIEGVAAGASEQAEAIEMSSHLTRELSTAIHNVTTRVEQIEQVKKQVEVSAIKVREMGKRSAQIGAIVNTIDDISGQTNLLALNAAIEAARAGEHGKGFAVVADEVRKLAERASVATGEITELIRAVQQVASEAVTAMDSSAVQVDQQVAAITQATREMSRFSDELLAAMSTVLVVVEQNNTATEQMSAGSGQMFSAIEEIAGVSEENSAASEEVSAATEEMSAQVNEVTIAAQGLREMAQKLQHLISRFNLSQPVQSAPHAKEPPAHPAVRTAQPQPQLMTNGKH